MAHESSTPRHPQSSSYINGIPDSSLSQQLPALSVRDQASFHHQQPQVSSAAERDQVTSHRIWNPNDPIIQARIHHHWVLGLRTVLSAAESHSEFDVCVKAALEGDLSVFVMSMTRWIDAVVRKVEREFLVRLEAEKVWNVVVQKGTVNDSWEGFSRGGEDALVGAMKGLSL